MNVVYNVFQILNSEKVLAAVFSNRDAAKQYIFEAMWKHPETNYTFERWQVHDEAVW